MKAMKWSVVTLEKTVSRLETKRSLSMKSERRSGFLLFTDKHGWRLIYGKVAKHIPPVKLEIEC